MEKETVLNFAKKYGFRWVNDTGKVWNGYEIWNVSTNADGSICYCGLPYFVLVKGDEIRMSSLENDEWENILDALN